MPVHDWTRVVPGNFHDFHQTWIIALKRRLNHGILPEGYYAMAEQVAKGPIPDILTLERQTEGLPSADQSSPAALAVATHPPKVRFAEELEVSRYARRADRIAIHHANGDRVIGYIEIVSPGNKHSVHAIAQFLEKLSEAMDRGCHVLVIDVLPPGRHDPRGMHAAFWERYFENAHGVTPDEPFGMSSYVADLDPKGFFERVGFDASLPTMPLFLTPETYVEVPLEETYQTAWSDVPERWQRILEGPAGPPA